MDSLYLQGLIAGRRIVASKGLDALDRVISELQTHLIETTAVEIVAETR